MSLDALRQNGMMAHLINALEAKKDIGHYGRLVFAMVARHFLSETELIALIQKNPGVTDHEARSLYLQVQGKDYSPPRRERILEWQKEQTFPICRILKTQMPVTSTKISNFRLRYTSTSLATMKARRSLHSHIPDILAYQQRQKRHVVSPS